MRPLKFRARINEKGRAEHLAEWQYFTLDDLLDGHAYELDERIDRKTICRFTGLHDRHGKEVWEGAKLKSGEGSIGIVSWGDGFWKIDFPAFSTGLSSEYARRLEVIGTIYEGGE